jgi:uncharacterized sulfatase
MDRQFGKLFDHLRADPALRDNTLVLICSDNGPEPGAGSAGPFLGAKGTLYEGGIRSPLIAWAPGLMAGGKAGTTDRAAVFGTMDIPPSVLAITGLPPAPDAGFDGEDFSAVLLAKDAVVRKTPLFWRRPPDRVSWQQPGHAGKRRLPDLAIRDGAWKLLCAYDGTAPQLYDLAKDRAETANLAADQPAVVRRLTERVLAWHQSMPPDHGARLAAAEAKDKPARK